MKCSVPTKNSKRSTKNSWHKPTLCRKTLQKDVRKSCRIWLNVRTVPTEAYQSMQKAQQDAMAPIYKKLDEAIQAVGKTEGVVYIFDLARTPIPFVGAQSVDVTAKVKTQLGIK